MSMWTAITRWIVRESTPVLYAPDLAAWPLVADAPFFADDFDECRLNEEPAMSGQSNPRTY